MRKIHDMPENPIGPVPVEVYPMVPAYLNRREQDVLELQHLLRINKFDEIRFLAHQLKGSGGGYGLSIISEIGRDMERAAVQQDRREVGELIEHLSNAIRYLKPHFKI